MIIIRLDSLKRNEIMVNSQLQKYFYKAFAVLAALIIFFIYGVIAGYNFLLGFLLVAGVVYVFVYYNFPHWFAYFFIATLSFAELLHLPVTQGGFSSAVVIAASSLGLGIFGALATKDRHLMEVFFSRIDQIFPVLLFMLMVVSLMNSRAIGYSVKQIQQYIYLLIIYYFLHMTIINREILRKALFVLFAGGGCAGLFGISEAIIQKPIYFLLGNKSLLGASVADALLNAKRGRIIGLIGDAPFHGIFMAVITLVSLYFLYTSKRLSARILSILIFIISVFNVMGTGSRGAFFSMAFALILFWFLADIPNKATIMFSSIIVGIVLTVFMVFYVSDLNVTRSFTYSEQSTDTARMRLKNIPVAFKMFIDHPIIGSGPDGFVINYTRYAAGVTNLAFRKKILKTHNTPLQVLVEYGLAGITVFGAIIFMALKRMVTIMKDKRDRDDSLIAVILFAAISAYIFFMLTSNSLLDKYFWLLIAMAQIHYSICNKPEQRKEISV